MALIQNDKYNTLFVEAQKDFVTKDPFNNSFAIYQGMQFKYSFSQLMTVGCCGKMRQVTQYLINSFAHCNEGEYLWSKNNLPAFIIVDSDIFVETDNLKLPPVTASYFDETSGKDTDLFTPPWKRAIPREGNVWYIDPWQSQKDA